MTEIYKLICQSDKVLYDFIQSQEINAASVLKTDEQLTEEAKKLEGYVCTSFNDDFA